MKVLFANFIVLLISMQVVQSTNIWRSYKKTYPDRKYVQTLPYIFPIYPDTSNDICIGKFVCSDKVGDCIDGTKVCNGMSDCSEGEDEKHCPPRCSDMNMMSCKDGRTCGKLCDGKQDCPGGEDERFCPDSCFCPEGSYLCINSKKCLPKSRVCDGKNDCLMSDDEWECPDKCQCGGGKYLCNDEKTCLDGKKLCDGTEQCPHGDDEASCPYQCRCDPGSFICSNVDVCVPYDNICENQGCLDVNPSNWDCPNGEDESTALCGPCGVVE